MAEFETVNKKRVDLGTKSFYIKEVKIMENGVERSRILQIDKKRVMVNREQYEEGSLGIEPRTPGRIKELGEALIELAEEWDGVDISEEDTGDLPY